MIRTVATLLLLLAALASAARAQYVDGELGGADYLIQKPAGWNGGGLVIYAHGYEGEGPGSGTVRPPDMSGHYAASGVAWAATGYRSKGYRPDWFIDDVIALHDLFIARHGKPKWTILHGQSMGGHVTMSMLEQHPGRFQAGFTECGVVSGVGIVDWLMAYSAAAEYFSGLPLLDTPRPAFERLLADFAQRIGTPGSRTEAGRRFDSVVKHLAGGDLPMREQGLALRWLANLNPRDPGPQRAQELARHADTRHFKYEIDPGLGVDAETLNREIRRAEPAAGARTSATPAYAPMTGKITVPVMTVHETGDFRAPFRLEQDYRRIVQAAGTGHLVVQRAQAKAGHCGIDGKLRETAFSDLVAWIERGVVPKGDDVLGDVSKLGR